MRNYRDIFIVYSHHSYVIRTEGVNDLGLFLGKLNTWNSSQPGLDTAQNPWIRINTKGGELR